MIQTGLWIITNLM